MKLISKDGAMATYTASPDEIKPLKGYYLAEVFRQVGERYHFQTFPTPVEATKSGAKFQLGRFVTSDGTQINIAELGIFNDGVNVTSSDTEDAEIVARDLILFLKERFGFREPSKPFFRTFRSDLVVDLEVVAQQKIEFLTPVLKLLQEEMEAISSIPTPFQFHRVAFAFEPVQSLTEFTLERRIGVPWNQNRYFSKAGLTTAAHLRVLELLESCLR